MKTCILKAVEIVCLWKTMAERIFGLFCKFRQPTEEQSQVVCYVFCCTQWKHRHFGCCSTSHIYLWHWWDCLSLRSSWDWCLWWISQQQIIFSILSLKCWTGLAVSGGHEFWTFHHTLHQEALCCKSLKMDHVRQVVVWTVISSEPKVFTVSLTVFIRDKGFPCGLPYYTEVRCPSRGAVLKRFFIYVRKLKTSWMKRQASVTISVLRMDARPCLCLWILHSTWIIWK